MERLSRLIFTLLAMTMHFFCASAQRLVFSLGNNWSAAPVQLIDSIKITQVPTIDLYFKDRTVPVQADTLFWNRAVPDTLNIQFLNDSVIIQNPHIESIQTVTNRAEVTVISTSHSSFVCMATGNSNNGRLVIENDTTFTLVLAGLTLSSQRASAISIPQKQKARIVLADGTFNTLSDATTYQADSTDTSNGCLYSKGSLAFSGSGTLCVTGNNRHAISSGKNITVEDCHIIISNSMKDGLHSDKLRIDGGTVELHLSTDASKGIKCKEDITMTGGRVVGEATGNLTIEKGETTFCSLLKSGGTFHMEGGEITLRHHGNGGRCISVDGNMTMTAGSMDLECHGDGGNYLTQDNVTEYYTPKCITIDGCTNIERGKLCLLATGDGGKCIACFDTLFIGRQGEDFIPEDSLLIIAETRGTALVDNFDEDFRKGCPKAIKSDNDIYVYSGTLRIKTYGQGGEGIESKGSFRTYYSTIFADCYDDGINTGLRCFIDGAHVLCISHHNDGIDSNGKVSILNGIVAAISEDQMNESFDTEGGCLYLYGGHVIGIGNNEVPVNMQSTIPHYSTKLTIDDYGRRLGNGISIHSGNFLTVSKDDEAILSLYHDYANDDTFILVASPLFEKGKQYKLSDGKRPTNISTEMQNGQVLMGGTPSCDDESFFNFIPE